MTVVIPIPISETENSPEREEEVVIGGGTVVTGCEITIGADTTAAWTACDRKFGLVWLWFVVLVVFVLGLLILLVLYFFDN